MENNICPISQKKCYCGECAWFINGGCGMTASTEIVEALDGIAAEIKGLKNVLANIDFTM